MSTSFQSHPEVIIKSSWSKVMSSWSNPKFFLKLPNVISSPFHRRLEVIIISYEHSFKVILKSSWSHLMHISYCYQYIHLFHRVWTSFFLQFCTRDHLCFGGLRYHHCLLLQFHLGRYGFGTGVVQKHKFYFVWLHFSIILNR